MECSRNFAQGHNTEEGGDRGVAGSIFTSVAALCPCILCLEMVQPRKTRLDMTEKCCLDVKNQTKQKRTQYRLG